MHSVEDKENDALIWAIPGLLFSSFQHRFYTVDSRNKFSNDFTRTAVLWCWKRPLCQLSYSLCPKKYFDNNVVWDIVKMWRFGRRQDVTVWTSSIFNYNFRVIIYYCTALIRLTTEVFFLCKKLFFFLLKLAYLLQIWSAWHRQKWPVLPHISPLAHTVGIINTNHKTSQSAVFTSTLINVSSH